jgi:hypothetical protein
MKPVIVFAGPSLPVRPAWGPAIRLRPPARCGDLIRAAREGPAAIALVDGIFETAPSVWHKEILAVIDAGVPVYGAASLGALRAAELDRFGMIGVGAIYAAYRDGGIESDAAVMVSHAPAELGHRPLTLALVDAEAVLRVARLDLAERRALLAIARGLNFRVRSWAAIIAAFADRAGAAAAERVACAIAGAAFSQKERDTAELLERLATDRFSEPVCCDVPRTLFLERLLSACA